MNCLDPSDGLNLSHLQFSTPPFPVLVPRPIPGLAGVKLTWCEVNFHKISESTLELQNTSQCPSGTVPIPRPPKERLMAVSALPSPEFPGLAPTRNSPNKSVHVPSLFRDLPGNLVGAHRVVIWLLAEAEVVAQVDEGQGDSKPHAQQGHHRGERHLRAQHREAPQGTDAWGQG